jgi:hypothetical protein
MMKKLFAALFACIFLVSVSFAAGSQGSPGGSQVVQGPTETLGDGSQAAGSGANSSDTQGQKEIETETEKNLGESQGMEQNQNQNENMVANSQGKGQGSVNASELREQIQERERELSQTQGSQSDAIKNQNKVRLAVHAFLASENRTGGIGQNVSQIARDFDNSVNKTVQAEEKINSRNGFTKFLFGGDKEASAEIEEEVARNRDRIQELNQLLAQCKCDEEAKLILREQLATMEQEQTRLAELAQQEKQNRGIFGWLWN